MMRLGVVVLAALAAACSGSESKSLPTLPSPVPPVSVDAFTGTLSPLGNNLHAFNVTQTGYVEVTLVGVTPQLTNPSPTPITVGLAVGTPSGSGTCLVLYTVKTTPGPTAQIIGTATAGPACLSIFDAGTLSDAVNYAVTVAHS